MVGDPPQPSLLESGLPALGIAAPRPRGGRACGGSGRSGLLVEQPRSRQPSSPATPEPRSRRAGGPRVGGIGGMATDPPPGRISPTSTISRQPVPSSQHRSRGREGQQPGLVAASTRDGTRPLSPTPFPSTSVRLTANCLTASPSRVTSARAASSPALRRSAAARLGGGQRLERALAGRPCATGCTRSTSTPAMAGPANYPPEFRWEELGRLRRQNQVLRQEREIPRKAVPSPWQNRRKAAA
jgi:hypothetical protein